MWAYESCPHSRARERKENKREEKQRELVYVLCHLRVYVLLYLCIMPFKFKLWKCVLLGTLMFVRRSSVGY